MLRVFAILEDFFWSFLIAFTLTKLDPIFGSAHTKGKSKLKTSFWKFLTLINSNTGEIFTSKVLTTPSDPSIGFISAVEKILKVKKIQPEFLEYVVHATTVATNAIIEGKIAKTAFITTEGFRDMLEIARQIRPSLYDLQFKKPKPLIPRQLCFEVTERMNSKGEIIKPIDKKSMDKIIDLLIENKVDAVAICLLHSYIFEFLKNNYLQSTNHLFA